MIDLESITPFCASSDENRSEKSQSCLHELGFLHGYSRSAATMTERSSGIKLRARAAMRIEVKAAMRIEARAAMRTGGDYGLKKTGECAALRSN